MIERVARTLPANLQPLATTATANDRVMDNLAAVPGPGLEVFRGGFDRPLLLLAVSRVTGVHSGVGLFRERVEEVVDAAPGIGAAFM